jgi:hypothetical protein
MDEIGDQRGAFLVPEHDFAAGVPRPVEQVPREEVLGPFAAALPAEMDDIGFRRIRRRLLLLPVCLDPELRPKALAHPGKCLLGGVVRRHQAE